MQLSRVIAPISLLFLAGCASAPASPPAVEPVASFNPTPPTMVFSGQFQPVMNTMSGSGMSSGSIRITGKVQITSAPGSDDRFTVLVQFNSLRGAESLYWGVVEGSCGAASLPLVPPRDLATIEVPDNGEVHFTSDLRAVMTPNLTYHLNLYANGGTDIESVIGCANLKRG